MGECPFCGAGVDEDLIALGGICPRCFGEIPGEQTATDPGDDLDDVPAEIRDELGSGMCNITRCCTEVCPEHINITDNGIIPMKERVVDRYYDPVRWLGRKLFGTRDG